MVRRSLRVRVAWPRQDIDVVGEAADGEEVLRVCGDLHPDLVLMDLRPAGVEQPRGPFVAFAAAGGAGAARS